MNFPEAKSGINTKSFSFSVKSTNWSGSHWKESIFQPKQILNLTITKRKELIECHPERSSYLTIRRMKRQGKLFPPPLSFAFVIEKCPEKGANIQSNKKEGWHVISRKLVMGLFSSSLEMPLASRDMLYHISWMKKAMKTIFLNFDFCFWNWKN